MSNHKNRLKKLEAAIGHPLPVVVWRMLPDGNLTLVNGGALDLPLTIAYSELGTIEATNIVIQFEAAQNGK